MKPSPIYTPMHYHFVTCSAILSAVKRNVATPTPTRFLIFVKLILIAPIKPRYAE
jgi:hypothetical protein